MKITFVSNQNVTVLAISGDVAKISNFTDLKNFTVALSGIVVVHSVDSQI